MTLTAQLLLAGIALMPMRPEHFRGYLAATSMPGELAGEVVDLGNCRHNVTLDLGTMKFDFPSADSCGDPVDVPDLVIDLTASSVNDAAMAGTYVVEPNCWQTAGAGQFALTQVAPGRWYLDLSGYRPLISYAGCELG
jgi:hypothetical protein